MKYLQIYEAFESSIITKTIKFINSKNINTKYFERDLVLLQKKINYPLSNISDNDVKYLKFNKAAKLKSDKRVENSLGIYCIKYWFSLINGYLGSTITGNTEIGVSSKNGPFFEKDIEYIKSELEIKTGALTPINDYLSLKDGDKVIVLLGNNKNAQRKICMGTIVRYDTSIYIIQNNSSGASPTSDGFDSEWTKYGRYGWIIYSSDEDIHRDHSNLHLYTESNDELHYDYNDDSYLTYNLKMDNDFYVYGWDTNNIFINDADFAIVVMVDDILKQGKLKSAISDERKLSRSGATKLMSDEEIRNFNINKYINIEISKMINKDTAEFYNLQKIVSKIFNGKYVLFALLSNSDVQSIMSRLMELLLAIVINVDKGNNSSPFIKEIVYLYRAIIKTNNSYIKKFQDSLEVIKLLIENDDIKIIVDKIESMSNKIYNYLQKQNIQTIEDLKIISVKLDSIRHLFRSNEFNINQADEIRYLISNFYSPNEIQHSIEYFNKDKSYKKIIESIKIIEKHIDSDFK
jgi:hypothetical protein